MGKVLNSLDILNVLIYTQEKLRVINFDINTLPFIHLLTQKTKKSRCQFRVTNHLDFPRTEGFPGTQDFLGAL